MTGLQGAYRRVDSVRGGVLRPTRDLRPSSVPCPGPSPSRNAPPPDFGLSSIQRQVECLSIPPASSDLSRRPIFAGCVARALPETVGTPVLCEQT
jgi:hypothetical protein